MLGFAPGLRLQLLLWPDQHTVYSVVLCLFVCFPGITYKEILNFKPPQTSESKETAV